MRHTRKAGKGLAKLLVGSSYSDPFSLVTQQPVPCGRQDPGWARWSLRRVGWPAPAQWPRRAFGPQEGQSVEVRTTLGWGGFGSNLNFIGVVCSRHVAVLSGQHCGGRGGIGCDVNFIGVACSRHVAMFV